MSGPKRTGFAWVGGAEQGEERCSSQGGDVHGAAVIGQEGGTNPGELEKLLKSSLANE